MRKNEKRVDSYEAFTANKCTKYHACNSRVIVELKTTCSLSINSVDVRQDC